VHPRQFFGAPPSRCAPVPSGSRRPGLFPLLLGRNPALSPFSLQMPISSSPPYSCFSRVSFVDFWFPRYSRSSLSESSSRDICSIRFLRFLPSSTVGNWSRPTLYLFCSSVATRVTVVYHTPYHIRSTFPAFTGLLEARSVPLFFSRLWPRDAPWVPQWCAPDQVIFQELRA